MPHEAVIAGLQAENAQLRVENEQLRAEVERLKEWTREEVRQAQREAGADAEFAQKRADSVAGQLAVKARGIERLRKIETAARASQAWHAQWCDVEAADHCKCGLALLRAALSPDPGGEEPKP